jgi:hypothetical protein
VTNNFVDTRFLHVRAELWSSRNKRNNAIHGAPRYKPDNEWRSLWSAAVWSRFGSPLLNSSLPRRMSDSSIRSDGRETIGRVPAKGSDQRMDYQSGSKQRRHKSCRIYFSKTISRYVHVVTAKVVTTWPVALWRWRLRLSSVQEDCPFLDVSHLHYVLSRPGVFPVHFPDLIRIIRFDDDQ